MVIINSLYFTQNPYSNIFLNHITNGGSGLDRDIISDVITNNKSMCRACTTTSKATLIRRVSKSYLVMLSFNSTSAKTNIVPKHEMLK